MGYLFLSYSSKDATAIEQLSGQLTQLGIDVWLDRYRLRGGDQWREEIVEAIKGCDRFLIALSDTSIRSTNVRKELDLAEEYRKPVIPIVLMKTTVPSEMEYQLVGTQWISFEADYQAGFEKLLVALGKREAELKKTKAPSEGKVSRATAHKKPSTPIFDQRGQQVGQQFNIAGDMDVESIQGGDTWIGQEIHFGAAASRDEVVAQIEELREQLEALLTASKADEETATDARYQMDKAVQQSQKPEADKKKIIDHLEGAKNLIAGLAGAAGLVKVFIEAAQAVRKFF